MVHAERQIYVRPLRTEMKVLNVDQVNMQKVLIFMQRVKTSSIPKVFKPSFTPLITSYTLPQKYLKATLCSYKLRKIVDRIPRPSKME